MNSAVNRFLTSALPPIPMEKELLCKSIKIEEEIKADNGEKFSAIDFFGYQFKPVMAYIMEWC